MRHLEEISDSHFPPFLMLARIAGFIKGTKVANKNAPRHSDDKKMAIAGDWLRDRVSKRLLIAALQPILACADTQWDVSLIIFYSLGLA